MSDRDNFAGGFLAGAILGGVLGGILGATLTQRQSSEARLADVPANDDPKPIGQDSYPSGDASRFKRDRPRRWIRRASEPGVESSMASEDRIEEARRNLEHKITALNIAIDDARQQLGEAGAASMVSHDLSQHSLDSLDSDATNRTGTAPNREPDSPAA